MQVDDALIEKLGRLTMLKFDSAEHEVIKTELQKMLGFIDKLKEFDTAGIEPLLHMKEQTSLLREDQPANMLSEEEALRNAPERQDSFFKVPTVIKKPIQS